VTGKGTIGVLLKRMKIPDDISPFWGVLATQSMTR
jgi:hypothetical protein